MKYVVDEETQSINIYHIANIRKQDQLLIKLEGKLDSDILEIKLYNPKENSLITKQLCIFRKLTSTELKYLIIDSDIYFLINSEKMHFLSFNLDEDKLREFPVINEIGKNPSLFNISNKMLIFLGGINSENVFTFDLLNKNFDFVGKMSSVRYGGYIINHNETIYICGGVNQENDNTLEVESFHLNKHYEIKTVLFENSYLLRKINPFVFDIGSDEMFLVSGGYCLFDKTDTSCFVQADKLNAHISSVVLLKPVSSFNPVTLFYKGIYYFYGEEENEIFKFSTFSKSFSRIKKEDIVFI